MAEIINELTLDVARENRIQAVLGKQYDYKSRYLKVRIANNGEPIFVTAGTVVTINATRADKQNNSFLGVVNDDGTVTVPITQWMLALDDYVKCDISMTDPQGRKLTTANFTVEVEHSNYTGGNLAEVTSSIGSSTGITAATVDGTTFIGKVGTAEEKTYTFSYDGSKWTLDSSTVILGDYGITVVGTPASGDAVTVAVKENTGGLLVDLLADIAELSDAVNKKANTDGYYSSLGAGTADQLNSPDGTIDNSAFTFRTTAGSESVTTGNARIKSIRGKTIVWNQLMDKSEFQSNATINGVTFTDNGDGSITVNGTADPAIVYYRVGAAISVSVGHKLLIASGISGGGWGSYLMYDDANLDHNSFDVSGIGKIYTAGASFAALYISIDKDYTANNLVFKPQLFDLTQMFGAGNEPATAAEFRTMFPKGYYEYNAGQLLSAKPSGMVTAGFNQWDEVSQPGGYITDNGDIADWGGDRLASKNHIPVFPNTQYFFQTPYSILGYGIRIAWYDADKNLISVSTKYQAIQTSPDNARYMRFCPGMQYGSSTYNHDICVNLSWSGSKNGTYEPYEKHTRAVDTATYFPNGMRSAGSAYDEMDFERRKAIKRIGVVDLGSLNWFYEPTTPNERFVASVDGIKIVSGSAKGNLVCSKYTTTSVDDVYSHTADKTIAVHNTAEQVWVYDTAYTDAATFKAAMSGVMLYYELATPTEFDIPDTVSNIYYADDWGTEEWMQDASATIPVPVPATLFYMRNLVDEIRNVRKNCLETADSLDNLLTALGTACGGTFTKTWSDTDQEWKFTFTASAASQTTETEVAT